VIQFVKSCALKINKINEDIALKRHFLPIIEPLKRIIENIVGKESKPTKKEENIANIKLL